MAPPANRMYSPVLFDAALWERGGEDLVDEDGHGATLLGGGIVPGRQRAVSIDGELKFWILSSCIII